MANVLCRHGTGPLNCQAHGPPHWTEIHARLPTAVIMSIPRPASIPTATGCSSSPRSDPPLPQQRPRRRTLTKPPPVKRAPDRGRPRDASHDPATNYEDVSLDGCLPTPELPDFDATATSASPPQSTRATRPLHLSLTQKLSNAWKSQSTILSDSAGSRSSLRSPQQSPIEYRSDFMATLTGDDHGEIKLEDKGGGLSTWFSGSSAPVNLGVPPPEVRPTDGSTPRPPAPSSSTLSLGRSSPASKSRFSFFSFKASQDPVSSPFDTTEDELLGLDVATALSQADAGRASDNAATDGGSLLQRLQQAYRSRTALLKEAIDEKGALQEEKEEAETRSKHLKMQLEQIASRMTERETILQELAAELALERQRRREEEQARKRSVALVKQPHSGRAIVTPDSPPTSRTGLAKRSSTSTFASDSGFDSEDDSAAESIFSRAQGTTSPTGTVLSSTTGTTSPEPDYHWQGLATTSPSRRPGPPPRESTFDRVLKVISTTREQGLTRSDVELARAAEACSPSLGGQTAKDWRTENQLLRERVLQLEGAVEGCLDFLSGPRM